MIFKLVKLGILCRSFPQYFKVYNYSNKLIYSYWYKKKEWPFSDGDRVYLYTVKEDCFMYPQRAICHFVITYSPT